jgi:pheromone shutdown protein TraB
MPETDPNQKRREDDPQRARSLRERLENLPIPGFLRRFLSSTYLISRALVRDQVMRRNIMMWTVMTAVVMLFVGWTFLDGWLRENYLLFILFWLVVAWLTVFSALMAVFDMLIQVAKGRARGKKLRKEILLNELEKIKKDMEEKKGE